MQYLRAVISALTAQYSTTASLAVAYSEAATARAELQRRDARVAANLKEQQEQSA